MPGIMITTGLGGIISLASLLGGQLPPITTADYVVHNATEFNNVLALGVATLSGKTIELNGTFAPLTIPALAFTQETVIRGAVGNKVHGINFTGNVSNLTTRWLNVQVQGWPKKRSACIDFGLHTLTNCVWDGNDFSHGHGAALTPIDVSATLPEYQRILHSGTAGTGGTSVALTWPAPAQTFGWIEFWNDSAEPLYVKRSNNAVDVATSADITVGPNQRYSPRIGANPSNAAYIHVSASATTVNFRCTTEQGLTGYLADAFASGGGSRLIDCSFIGNHFHDLSNAMKFMPDLRGKSVWMDNTARRIYQDIWSRGWPFAANCSLYLLRNTLCQPFALSGIDNLVGDAQDPHGDIFQIFAATFYGTVYSAGNRTVRENIRSGAGNQGAHYWTNWNGGAPRDSFIVGDLLFLNSNNGLTATAPNEYLYVYGCTILNPLSPIGTNGGKVSIGANGLSGNYFGFNVTNDIPSNSATAVEGNTLLQGTPVTSIMPNFNNLFSATDRATLDAAMATSGAYILSGAVAASDKLDWTTKDPDKVIKFDLLPPGLAWNSQTVLNTSTVVYTKVRKVMAGPAVSAISVGAGTEYQITSDVAGTAVVTAWTSAPGTIARGQFLQLRGTTSAANMTTTTLSVTVNGYTTTTSLQTKAADPTTFFTTAAGGPTFANAVNMGAGKSKITFRAMMRLASLPSSSQTLFSISSNNLIIEVMNTGNWRVTLRDSAGTTLINTNTVAAAITPNVWTEVIFSIDLANSVMRVRSAGVVTDTIALPANSGLLPSARYPLFLSKSTGGTSQIVGSFSELELWYDATTDGSAPAGAADKRIAGSAATVNADPWKKLANAT